MNRLIVNSVKQTLIYGSKEIRIVLGRNGCKKEKHEGDGATPVGQFLIGPVFGHGEIAPIALKTDYLPLYPDTLAIDDPCSKYYNKIVRESEIVDPDWKSAERMGEEPLYELGAVIQYNWPRPVPGKGSAIFLHQWRDAMTPTAGCIAMSRENLIEVLGWLDHKTFVIVDA